jgi:hypothetical protein
MTRRTGTSVKPSIRPFKFESHEHDDGKQISRPAARRFFDRGPVRVTALAVVLTILVAPTLLPKYSVVDNDIWLHLKVGDWVVEHYAVPHTGILSRTAGDRPWMAYSWIYEVLLSRFHAWFHLIGISVFGMLLTLAVAYSVFWMTRRVSGSFWRAGLLAAATCAAFLFNVFPRPVSFSMSLFTVTLVLLLEARRTGHVKLLYWLPPLFVLWANVHIQFIYGIFLVALFVSVSLIQHLAIYFGLAPDSLVPPNLPCRTLYAFLFDRDNGFAATRFYSAE